MTTSQSQNQNQTNNNYPRFVLWIGLLFFTILFVLLNHSITLKGTGEENTLGNYEPVQEDTSTGPRSDDQQHKCHEPTNKAENEWLWKYGINMACSAGISFSRTLPDTRHQQCRHLNYPTTLPTTSVIIVFYNAGYSTLIRNIYSIIHRSPASLLREIILIDDASTMDELKLKLEMVVSRYSKTIRLYRNAKRKGLLQSRMDAANYSVGDVLVFVDVNCEVNVNWLPPLLEPILNIPSAVTVPVNDVIDGLTFDYRATRKNHEHVRGLFDWSLQYREFQWVAGENTFRAYETPIIKGLIYAINRNYFFKIGGVDVEFNYLEVVNFDLSFRVWTCGGKIIQVPCSRVGQITRSAGSDAIYHGKRQHSRSLENKKRIAEKWFDNKTKEFFYTMEPTARSVQVQHKNVRTPTAYRPKCKNFQWYLEKVVPDIWRYFPAPPRNEYWGELKSKGTLQCVDNLDLAALGELVVRFCDGHTANQMLRLNTAGQLALGNLCVDGDVTGMKQIPCKTGTVNGPWRYIPTDGVMLHMNSLKCLGIHIFTRKLRLFQCFRRDRYQQWIFNNHFHWN